MARTVLHSVYPFREGTDRAISDWHFLTIEMETAPSKTGFEPFRIVWHAVAQIHEYRFTHVTDAVEALPALVADMTRNHSGRDWSHLPPRYPTTPLPDCLKLKAVRRMMDDMSWTRERAELEYESDPAQRF